MNLFISPKIEARPSPLGGYGVFAKEPIAAGEQLEVDHFIMLPDKYPVPVNVMEYAFGFPKGTGHLAIVFGLASIYNSAYIVEDANADWKTDEEQRVFIFFATKDIAKDEEILTFYNNYQFSSSRH